MSLSKSDTSKLIILVSSITSYFHSEHFYSGLAYAHCTTWYIILQILACDKTQPFPTNLAQLRAVETMTLPSYDTSILTTLTYRSARVGYTWWTYDKIWSVLESQESAWSEVKLANHENKRAMQKKVTGMLIIVEFFDRIFTGFSKPFWVPTVKLRFFTNR